MKLPRFSSVFGGCAVLFGWGCWVVAYLYGAWWWLVVSLIPYMVYQTFFNRDDGGPSQ